MVVVTCANKCADLNFRLRTAVLPPFSGLSRHSPQPCQRNSACGGQSGALASAYVKSKLLSLIQNLFRDHPASGNNLCRFPLSLRNVENLLCEQGINISQESNRFRRVCRLKMFAAGNSSVNNPFGHMPERGERHHFPRAKFKLNHAAVLAVRRGRRAEKRAVPLSSQSLVHIGLMLLRGGIVLKCCRFCFTYPG